MVQDATRTLAHVAMSLKESLIQLMGSVEPSSALRVLTMERKLVARHMGIGEWPFTLVCDFLLNCI